MKKMTLSAIAFVFALAMIIVPYSVFACDGSKSTTTSKTDATMINSKAAQVNMDGKKCDASCTKKCCASLTKTNAKVENTGMVNAVKTNIADTDVTESRFATAVFSVNGMTCSGCEKSVNGKLTKMDGVNEVVKVCHKSGSAVLTYDPDKVNTEELAKTITDMGFKAEYKTDKYEVVEGGSM